MADKRSRRSLCIGSANPQEETSIQESDKTLDTAKPKEPIVVTVERRPDVRYNGFQRPFNPLQVISWIVFFFDFFSYYLINMVSLMGHSLAIVLICSLVYLTICVMVLYYAILATVIDPSDPTIYEQRLTEAQGKIFDGSSYPYECDICETSVTESAKHCGSCNRCVSNFDHHCRWLNNCIGGKNYKLFFRLIIWVFVMSLIHNITNMFVIYNLATAAPPTVQGHEQVYKAVLLIEFQVLIGLACFFNFLALLFLGHLTAFHIMLQRKGMTTYEYLRWKANNTRTSKIVKRKADKEKAMAADIWTQEMAQQLQTTPNLDKSTLEKGALAGQEGTTFGSRNEIKMDETVIVEGNQLLSKDVQPCQPLPVGLDVKKQTTEGIDDEMNTLGDQARIYAHNSSAQKALNKNKGKDSSGDDEVGKEIEPEKVRDTENVSNFVKSPIEGGKKRKMVRRVLCCCLRTREDRNVKFSSGASKLDEDQIGQQKEDRSIRVEDSPLNIIDQDPDAGAIDDREAQIEFRRDASSIANDENSENIKSQSMIIEKDFDKATTRQLIKNDANSMRRGSDIQNESKPSKPRVSSDDMHTIQTSKMAHVLTLGAGGDTQAHVTRPKTASSVKQASNTLKRVNSQLETITENNQAEEDAIAISQGHNHHIGKFEVDASHSFSLRNYGKDKQSAQLLESLKIDGDGGKESAMSNYSRIQAESYQQRSQRDIHAGLGQQNLKRQSSSKGFGSQRKGNKSFSQTRKSRQLASSQSAVNQGQYSLPQDDDAVSQASSKFMTGNVETGGSQDEQPPYGMPIQPYIKDSGGLINSFSKFSNHNNQTFAAQTHSQILAIQRNSMPNASNFSGIPPQKIYSHTGPAFEDGTNSVMPEIAESVMSKEEDEDDDFNINPANVIFRQKESSSVGHNGPRPDHRTQPQKYIREQTIQTNSDFASNPRDGPMSKLILPQDHNFLTSQSHSNTDSFLPMMVDSQGQFSKGRNQRFNDQIDVDGSLKELRSTWSARKNQQRWAEAKGPSGVDQLSKVLAPQKSALVVQPIGEPQALPASIHVSQDELDSIRLDNSVRQQHPEASITPVIMLNMMAPDAAESESKLIHQGPYGRFKQESHIDSDPDQEIQVSNRQDHDKV